MSSPTFQLRVQVGPRDPERFPRSSDDALGEQLFAMAAGVLARGLPRPAMIVMRSEQVDRLDVVPLLKAEPVHRVRMLAAIAGQDGVECAALIGALRIRIGPMKQPAQALVCFVEWPDNRWWTCWQLVGSDRTLVGSGPVVRKAVDGWPRPGGVGGWFSLARRAGLKLKMAVGSNSGQTVH